jgi:hypothetical protein
MHQIITMAGTLSFRQIVLIRLINEGFLGIIPEMFITNPSACVEVSRMQDYGLWMTDKVTFKDDASAEIQIKVLMPTAYSKMVGDALMLDKLSEEDIKRTIESLALSEKGEPAEGITKEDFDASNFWTEYNEEEEKLSFKQGRPKAIRDVASLPDDMTHVMKGKDLVGNAKTSAHSGNYMRAIDDIMKALEEFKLCKSDKVRQPVIDDALYDLKEFFEVCKDDDGGLRILKGRRQYYKSVLDEIKGEYLNVCITFLNGAEEKEEGFDEELGQKEIDSWFKNSVAENEANGVK